MPSQIIDFLPNLKKLVFSCFLECLTNILTSQGREFDPYTYALNKDDDQIIEEAKKYYISREERTGDKLRKLFEQYKGTDCTKTVEWITADLEKKDGGYPVF